MHCYFVLAGDASVPILYHVERVRDGKSFITRTVQARQRGKCIFTTTCSFMREGSGGAKTVDHEWGMPEGMRQGLEDMEEPDGEEGEDGEGNGVQSQGPFISLRLGIANSMLPLSRAHLTVRTHSRMNWVITQSRQLSLSASQTSSILAQSPGQNHGFCGPSSPSLGSGIHV